MKLIAPDYYTQFKCPAGTCSHTCCAGWEIEIDAEHCAAYEKLSGIGGEPVSAHIARDSDGGAYFKLRPDGRCPLLTDGGLCHLILNYGDEVLCQTCADHPRFRSEFSDRTEIGLGLTCEEAARIILSQRGQMKLIELNDDRRDDKPAEDEGALLNVRARMLETIGDRTRPLSVRIAALIDEYALPPRCCSSGEWVEVYRGLERLDAEWSGVLDAISASDAGGDIGPGEAPMCEALLSYFVYRHLPGALYDGMAAQRLAFSILSMNMVRAAAHTLSLPPFEAMCEAARMYSSEIEYSDQNVDALLWEIDADFI